MKKTFLTFLGCLITLFAFAKNDIDPKYGIGAVPVDENGRVTFTESIQVPESMSAEQCYETLITWAKGRFAVPFADAGRILSENAGSHRFIFHVDQKIVFKSKALVVDESAISYNFSVSISNGTISMKMTDIKYRYEEGREGGGKVFSAEDWITDNECFNAKKTKFLRDTGKFRIKTIDLKDAIFEAAKDQIK